MRNKEVIALGAPLPKFAKALIKLARANPKKILSKKEVKTKRIAKDDSVNKSEGYRTEILEFERKWIHNNKHKLYKGDMKKFAQGTNDEDKQRLYEMYKKDLDKGIRPLKFEIFVRELNIQNRGLKGGNSCQIILVFPDKPKQQILLPKDRFDGEREILSHIPDGYSKVRIESSNNNLTVLVFLEKNSQESDDFHKKCKYKLHDSDFSTMDEAASAFGMYVFDGSKKHHDNKEKLIEADKYEYGCCIYKFGNKFYFTVPYTDPRQDGVEHNIPPDTTNGQVAYAHTHVFVIENPFNPRCYDQFSLDDINFAAYSKTILYLSYEKDKEVVTKICRFVCESNEATQAMRDALEEEDREEYGMGECRFGFVQLAYLGTEGIK
jgi:hypothetical protein